MFTIDLLKGKGLPAKRGPKDIVITSATFAVPVVTAIVIIGLYISNSIIISIRRQEISRQKADIQKLSAVIKTQKSLDREKNDIDNCISEAKPALGRHTQWSGVLQELVENMPNMVILTELEVKQTFIKSKKPKTDDPKVMVDITVPARTLHMSVHCASQSDCGEAIRMFRNHLYYSKLLGPRIEDIYVSQKSTRVNDRPFVSYEIDCIFKPGM